jgi:hypothetical protein
MYQIGTILIDTRTGKACHIENCVVTRKGTLYTIQYETGEYKRYYETSLKEKFYADRSNVIHIDFVLKRLVS